MDGCEGVEDCDAGLNLRFFIRHLPSRVKSAWYRTTVRTAAQDGFNLNSKLFKTNLVITPKLSNFKCSHEAKYIYDILNPIT
jgi:hypothetical protein